MFSLSAVMSMMRRENERERGRKKQVAVGFSSQNSRITLSQVHLSK